jgi:hypothetical protein
MLIRGYTPPIMTKFEVFTAVKIRIEFSVVTPCSVVVGY